MRYRPVMASTRKHDRLTAARRSTLAEYSSRLGVQSRRLEVAVEAAEALEEPEFRLLETLVELAHTSPRSLAVRRELSAGLCQELERFWRSTADADPLAEVDRPLEPREAASASLWADTEAKLNRARLLADCVSSREAGELTNRSRQAVERQRRQGNLLALPVGREWRYPKWQFDLDSRRGVVPGLDAVLRNLHLSPFGAARWLTTPKAELGEKAPIELLRHRLTDRVVDLAEQHGHAL
jgi:hypothetical protein